MEDDRLASGRRKLTFPLSKAGGAPFDLEMHLPFRLAVLVNLLQAQRDPQVKAMTDLGLRELRVLLNVGAYMPVRAADIGYQTRLDPGTISRGVATLVERGFVVASSDPTDQRSSLVELTDSGRELYEQVAGVLGQRATEIEEVLDPGEREMLFDFLARLEDKAEEVLARHALERRRKGQSLSADQREMLRWYRRTSGSKMEDG
ncbi:winged helix DNA-binding protein [Pseudaminobacter soli (ex Li et al. 2025)]|uniref:MarR family transcriptional regulator n=1 Tax=Pseudaminobacter soli (ex Li et al. 2025) TaxID=1295366 RepID=A0A2P7SMF9_9HYPH|nr:winged helix DNA-binding protein [Mesorhizobium soli]PSJ63652.1 MarR family transcriptional regulator [Mesorhizobium soli]